MTHRDPETEAPGGSADAPTHDDLVKGLLFQPRLLEQFFRAFVPDAFEFADFSQVEYVDKEHARARKRPRRIGDVLAKARWRGEETCFLLHIESQSSADPVALERVGEYCFRDFIRFRLPVLPVLLLTYPKPLHPHPDSLTWSFGEVATIHLRCPVLHFASMDPRAHLKSGNVSALALSSLMRLSRDQQVEAIIGTLAESLRQGLAPEELESATAFVRHYAPLDAEQLLQLNQRVRRLSEEEPELALMPTLVNPFVEIGRIEGLEQGLEQGLERGLEQGRAQGERALALRLMERKFPGAAERGRAMVEALEERDLLELGEALLFLENEEECLSWLVARVAG